MSANDLPSAIDNLTPETIQSGFASLGYICDESIAMAIYLATQLNKPILVEGPPGVGKTELAKATASLLELSLIRLQCYEGLDEAKALYEWKYGKQLLYTQVLKDKLGDLLKGAHGLSESVTRLHEFGDIFYSEEFLEPRPLLQALKAEHGSVLLIDEIDKSDHEFESFLLEMLSDYQISVPEIGTIKAVSHPIVFLTSNNTRELSDALKRRCLHLYIPFPDIKLEQKIIQSRVPEASSNLQKQLVHFVHSLREMDLKKHPSISETIDWARALVLLHASALEPDLVKSTLNLLLKHEEDIATVKPELTSLLNKSRSAR
ncbi:MAG: ATPase [Moraxellaceae bacterium]|nr:MAG: ATPase [Moraxellaceae bacterium]